MTSVIIYIVRRKIIIFIVVVILAIISGVILAKKRAEAPSSPAKYDSSEQTSNDNGIEQDLSEYTIDNQNSIYYIVNKQRALPSGFVPQNLVTVGNERLRSDAATTLNTLLSVAKKEGVSLRLISGYRSYVEQQRVYSGYVKSDGQAKADTYSARPGHSEHQTGLAIDVGSGSCDLQICFGDSKAGKWLADHAHEYGFIIRYGRSQENLTGYQYEPWHLRYVGVELASKLHASDRPWNNSSACPPLLLINFLLLHAC